MKQKKGFTLIELLTVVMIIGILTAIALPQYRSATERANAANALINLRSIFDAAKRYYSARSQWPTSLTGLDVTLMLNPGTESLAEEDVFQSGEFNYSFDIKSVSACRVKEGETAPYCLRAFYSRNGQRDVFICQYFSAKYQKLCESMGDCNGDTCTLK